MLKESVTLRDQVQKLLDDLQVMPDDGILVALSGGKDSILLTHLLHELGYRIKAGHINHKLRANESDEDESFVKDYCAKLGIPFAAIRYDTKQEAESRKLSIQEAARALRYEWLTKEAANSNLRWIATAHHLQDSIETFFINLSRGSGLKGLTGIPHQRDNIIRPLSNCKPSQLNAYLKKHDLPFREDASNNKKYYTRNKIRHEIIPILEKLPGDFYQSFSKNQMILKEHEAFFQDNMNRFKAKFLEENTTTSSILLDDLKKENLPPFLLYNLLKNYGFNRTQSDDILISNEGAIFSSHSHRANIRNGKLTLASMQEKIDQEQAYFIESEKGTLALNEGTLHWEVAELNHIPKLSDKNQAYLNLQQIEFPITIRRWQTGDRFLPLGMNGHSRLLSDYFKDKKFTKFQKESTWIASCHDNIAWIVGHHISEPYKLKDTSLEALHFTWKPFT